ncbi:U3 small nucleolar RNA-associated protein-like protein [Hapsidospora chrysogenum ATCC 11550]|uniref:U3 small nucleolar RNA-associated protein-like protein n=1 Tax=Hapsidospora chrysogenum (strain ATCC 11550 / CBS 779.69 / DSM 880 / IAM 14645 / JCM 23072 / IMI 49137) TaxID=857340 RepID=A0A086T0T6_HAPC1|nr:U3 small nucleolar RNA-associated protein-like protein [Hapsidospora chrysogenum ATCC 11550]
MAPQNDDHRYDESSAESDFSGFDSDDESQNAGTSATPFGKDSDEEELERLVLGNKAGFRENLFKGDGLQFDEDGNEVQLAGDDEAGDGMEDVDDADLFMFDTGTSGAGGQIPKPAKKEEKAEEDADAPAWEDSDDDRLAISLADASRLRKLRISEAEDVVSGTEYSRRLRQQYLRLNPLPSWVKPEGRPAKRRRRRRSSAGSDSSAASESGSDSDVEAQPLEKFLRNVNKLGGFGNDSRKRRLRPEVIDIQRTREIPDQHKAAVMHLSFHPEYPVLLSSSPASVLYLHHIAPEAHPTPNPQLTSVQVKQVDVRRAEFLYPLGDKIFFAGRRRFFHQWDLPSGVVQKTSQIQGHRLEHRTMEKFKLSPCGRYMAIVSSEKKGGGVINVLSTTSTHWIAAARLSSNHGIADFAWWSTGDGMTILGRGGQVGEFSMESKKFVGVWEDEGCVGGSVIALGGHQGPTVLGEDRWVAVGSSSGITNIYDRAELVVVPGDDSEEVIVKERPTPKRVLEQLITPVTSLTFSPDGQILAFASRHKQNALRLAHLPTCTVYRNWPTENTPFGRITAVAFGRQSDLLAVGNDVGKIRLWQIRS